MYLFMYNFQVREENKNNWEATWPWRKMDSDKWIMLAHPKCNGRQEKTELTAGHLSSCLRAEVSLWPCEKICRYSGYIKCYMWLMFSSIHDIESTICFADGQKIAIRLSKKISSICQKIKQKVKEFNIATRAVNQPHALDYNDVIQIDNPIWPTLTTREIDNMPVKQQLFVLWNTTRRANEEKAYLVEDCKSAKRFYEKQIMEIDRHSQPEGHSSNRQDRGATAALRSKRREFSRYLSQFASLLTALTTDDCDVNVENSTDSDTDEVEDV